MDHKNMCDKAVLDEQYKDSEKLDIRKMFHKKYSTNPVEYDDWIVSKIHFFEGCRILELGCGTGNLWMDQTALVDSFSELVLSDISEGMVESAKENHADKKRIKCEVIDTQAIPYPDGSFDIVVANSMLYHIPELEQAVKEIHRVLKTDGVFYATTASTSEGLMNYITASLYEMGLSETSGAAAISFSLENGEELLARYFSNVKRDLYDDRLEVTEVADLVAYIYSMSSVYYQLDVSSSADLHAYFEEQKDSEGIIKIPKLYGIFISQK